MRQIIPFYVRKDHIAWDMCIIDANRGYAEAMPPLQQDTMVHFRCMNYEELPVGRVFVPCDEDRKYAFHEPSCFLMKMRYGNWYLTGDSEQPLGIDRTEWDMVLAVFDNHSTKST